MSKFRRFAAGILVLAGLFALHADAGAAPARKKTAKSPDKPAPALGDAAVAREIEKLVAPTKGAPADTDSVRITMRLAYNKMDFRPVWTSEGTPRATSDELVAVLSSAASYGLDATDYPLTVLRDEAERLRESPEGDSARSPAALARWDALASETFLRFATQVAGGRVRPRDLYAEWYTTARVVDGVTLLQRVAGEGNLRDLLTSVEPPAPGYQHLKNAYVRYAEIAAQGGWGQTAYGDTFVWNKKDNRVESLRKRLVASGDLSPRKRKGKKYDAPVVDAVKTFQARNGLLATGVVDSNTVDVLNIPVAERMREMQLNLERWRWQPDTFGPFYVAVNIPEFTLRVMEQGKMTDSMRVIVGRYYHPTPVFFDSITTIIVNPDWSVPSSIARDELLPLAQRDSTYFTKQGIHVYRGGREIPADTVQWKNLTKGEFPYDLRQEAGPSNPLGRIKFLLPNRHDVYLHDTPSTELFVQDRRDFSYGCVRLQQPLRFAHDLLDPSEWPVARIDSLVATQRPDTLRVDPPVPVTLQYWTAWVDEAGVVQFRDDVYRLDFRQDWAWKQRDKVMGKTVAPPEASADAPPARNAAAGDVGP